MSSHQEREGDRVRSSCLLPVRMCGGSGKSQRELLVRLRESENHPRASETQRNPAKTSETQKKPALQHHTLASVGATGGGGGSCATIFSSSSGLGPHRLEECGRESERNGWRHPRPPSVRLLWREKATEAVLRDTRVGCRAAVMATIGPREEGGDLRGGGRGGGGGRAGPALGCFSFLFLFLFLFLSFPFPFPFFSFVTGGEGLGDKGAPLGPATVGLEKPAVAAMALRAACSGISKIPYTGVAAAN